MPKLSAVLAQAPSLERPGHAGAALPKTEILASSGLEGLVSFRVEQGLFSADSHAHSEIELGALLHGAVLVRSGRGVRTEQVGSKPLVFVVGPEIEHAVSSVPRALVSMIGVRLRRESFEPLAEDMDRRALGVLKQLDSRPAVDVARWIQRLHERLKSSAPALEQETLLLEVLGGLLATWRGLQTLQPPEAEVRQIDRARQYLEAHLDSRITLDELARQVGLGKFRLVRAFSRRCGLPPHTYQNRARLARSLHLLEQGMPITQVACELGFVDQSHFHRLFRGFFGLTPAAYMRLGKARGSLWPEACRRLTRVAA